MSFDLFTLFISLINIVLLIVIPYFIFRRLNSWLQKKMWYSRLIGWICVAMLLILLGSTVWFHGAINHKYEAASNPLAGTQSFSDDLRALALADEIDSNPNVICNRRFSFTYAGNELALPKELQDHMQSILVRTRQTKGNTVNVSLYSVRSWFNGVELSNYVQTPTLTIEGNRLVESNTNIKNHTRSTVKIKTWYPDLTVRQFYENLDHTGYTHYNLQDSYFMLIELPPSVKLSDSSSATKFY